jgi:hypothetical protein
MFELHSKFTFEGMLGPSIGGRDHVLVKMIIEKEGSGDRMAALIQSSTKMGTGVHGANGGREDDGEPGATFPTIRRADSPAMHAHDSFHERQPQATPGRISAPHATLEYLREDLRFEAGAVIFQYEQCAIFRAAERNCYHAGGTQML